MYDFKPMIETLMKGDQSKLTEMVNKALKHGVAANDILNQGLIAAMDIVGEKMEKEEMFIPEVLMAARTMGGGVKLLKPLLTEDEKSSRGKVIIGTVKGDLHDIGKNLVSMMLESTGMEVHNLGVDISPQQFVTEIKAKKADMLCLSALLTTTMPMMKETIDEVVKEGLRNQVKILIGGAPVTQKFANDIGADGYAPDAGSATKMAKSLI